MVGLLAGLAQGVAGAVGLTAKVAQTTATVGAAAAHETAKAADEVVQLGGLGGTVIGAMTQSLRGMTEAGVAGAEQFSKASFEMPRVNGIDFGSLGRGIMGGGGSMEVASPTSTVKAPAVNVARVTQFDVNPADEFQHGITFGGGGGPRGIV